jgi:hypothetical protein
LVKAGIQIQLVIGPVDIDFQREVFLGIAQAKEGD